MSSNPTDTDVACTPEEIDEAAVWITRLRGPDRTISVERGLRRWLAARPSHGAAFEIVSNAWELAGSLQHRPFPRVSRWERAGFRAGFARATLAVACAALVITLAAYLQLYDAGVTSGVGEQRTLTLDDGTRVFLNTSSRLVVDYDQGERHVELESGEALFEVAPRPDWPFVVSAGDQRITALGTSFVVRTEERDLSVTLIEGKVSVAPEPRFIDLPLAAAKPAPIILLPGQRLLLEDDEVPRLDRPSLEKLTAWRQGLVEFEETDLGAAAREMNRYSRQKVVLATPELASIRINGVFRAGDAAGFAAAVSRAYGLRLDQREHEIVLTSAAPRASGQSGPSS